MASGWRSDAAYSIGGYIDHGNSVATRNQYAAVGLIKALGGGWDASTLPTYDQLRSERLRDPKNASTVAQPLN